MEWHWWHFDAVDYNSYDEDSNAIYLFKDKEFDDEVDLEKGSFLKPVKVEKMSKTNQLI